MVLFAGQGSHNCALANPWIYWRKAHSRALVRQLYRVRGCLLVAVFATSPMTTIAAVLLPELGARQRNAPLEPGCAGWEQVLLQLQ